MRPTIFQIYFKPELVKACDPAFTPLDNTSNPRPYLREWDVWDREYENILAQGIDLWGFVSWNFTHKTGISGQAFVDFIEANPGHDVYFINPCIATEAMYVNPWKHCDRYNTTTADLGNEFLAKLGYKDIDVRTILLDRTVTFYANYLVGTKEFWAKFMDFSRGIFAEADKDPQFKEAVFVRPFGYATDATLPSFTFLIERLLPTFIALEQISACGYQYTSETVPEKYKPYFADLQALSSLKMLINEHNSDQLYDIWNQYRICLLRHNPAVLGLE